MNYINFVNIKINNFLCFLLFYINLDKLAKFLDRNREQASTN